MRIRYQVKGHDAVEVTLDWFIQEHAAMIRQSYKTMDEFRAALAGNIVKLEGPFGEEVRVAEVRDAKV